MRQVQFLGEAVLLQLLDRARCVAPYEQQLVFGLRILVRSVVSKESIEVPREARSAANRLPSESPVRVPESIRSCFLGLERGPCQFDASIASRPSSLPGTVLGRVLFNLHQLLNNTVQNCGTVAAI